MRFASSPQDFLAHVDAFGLKGASALCPCPACDNCIGRREYFDDDSGSCHVYSSSFDKFNLRSVAWNSEIVAELKSLAANGSNEELPEYANVTGLTYDSQGLLFDDKVAEMVRFPDSMYFDTTRCLWSSGGIGQFHVNKFIKQIISRTAIELKDLEDFAHMVRNNSSTPKLTSTFFRDRFVGDNAASLKAFESETLCAVRILSLFVPMVLKDSHGSRLDKEIECFEYLSDLMECLRRGDPTDAPIALRVAQRRHELYIELYPLRNQSCTTRGMRSYLGCSGVC